MLMPLTVTDAVLSAQSVGGADYGLVGALAGQRGAANAALDPRTADVSAVEADRDVGVVPPVGVGVPARHEPVMVGSPLSVIVYVTDLVSYRGQLPSSV